MKKSHHLSARFEELAQMVTAIIDRKQPINTGMMMVDRIDDEAFEQWKVSASHLLEVACGNHSQHCKRFGEAEKRKNAYDTPIDAAKRTRAVLLAAQNDFEGGYLTQLKNLVQADVFDDALEQAEELHRSGYLAASAVTAGVVLETTLRGLCDTAGVTAPNLNALNQELVKAGVYGKLEAKKVTVWTDIRNNAAHGIADKFGASDVADLIKGVREFVTNRLS